VNEAPFDEKTAVDRARSDPEAFAALYDHYIDRIYAFVVRRVGRMAEAEDIVAQTFTRALGGLDGFRWQGAGFGAWLFRIARNLVSDSLRAGARTSPLPQETPADRACAPGGSAAGDPEETLLQAEQAERLRRLIEELPEAQREVVLLKYTAGLGNKEIAAVTGRTATAVSSLVNRAVNNLRERLGDGSA